jgi:hypothetical protein
MTAIEKFRRLESFMRKAGDDPKMTAAHISLYVSLICLTDDKDDSLHVFSREVMHLCKISGSATYHRCIRQLDEFGYIKYFPSYNHYKRSRVEFVL